MRRHLTCARRGLVAGFRTVFGAAIGTVRPRRRSRHADTGFDLGGYPMDMLRDPRFTTLRRRVA